MKTEVNTVRVNGVTIEPPEGFDVVISGTSVSFKQRVNPEPFDFANPMWMQMHPHYGQAAKKESR